MFISSTYPSTLADLQAVVASASIPEPRRREMTSAINTIGKVLKRDLHLIPASVATLQPLIANAMPAAVGVSGQRWRNVKSLLRQTVALVDPAALPARSRGGLLPEWAMLVTQPEATPWQRGIARFSKWCSAAGIAPGEVTQSVYQRFYDELTEHCLLRSPRETQMTAGRAWNGAREVVPGWPQLEIQIDSRRRNPSLPWSAFPPTLKEEIDAYLTARTKTKLRFDKPRVLFRPETVKAKRAQLHQIATAIAQSGVPPQELKGLADLVDPENACAGLNVLLERKDQKLTSHTWGLAYCLLTIARHEVKAGHEAIEMLKSLCRELKPEQTGMTQKNSIRLRQFDDERVMNKYLLLPGRLMQTACSVKDPGPAEARMAQHAVALEILTFLPLRIANIASLEVGRTLMLSDKTGFIVVPLGEVKNEVDLEMPLPPSAFTLIKTYLKRFHPLLAHPGSKMLFPTKGIAHKNKVAFSAALRKLLAQECGIDFNAHVVRHLAAKLYLEAHPGQYGVVKLLLGHKSMETTQRFYCGMEREPAFRAYAALVESRRGGLDRKAS